MSDVSAALDWEELPEAEEPLGKRQLLMCPADNCQDMGSYEHLCEHWSRIHHAYTLLYPGDHSPLTSTQEVPEGTFRFRDKIRASVLLQEKLRALQVKHAISSTQPPPSAPQPSASTASAPPSGQSEGFSAVRSATSPPATSSRKVVDQNASVEQLELHLRQIRHQEVALWHERDNVLHCLKKGSSDKIAQLRQEVHALRQRVVFLEGENRRLLKPDREPRPVIVGHLECIPPAGTHLFILWMGKASVYWTYQTRPHVCPVMPNKTIRINHVFWLNSYIMWLLFPAYRLISISQCFHI